MGWKDFSVIYQLLIEEATKGRRQSTIKYSTGTGTPVDFKLTYTSFALAQAATSSKAGDGIGRQRNS